MQICEGFWGKGRSHLIWYHYKVTLLQRLLDRKLLTFHCILLQDPLYAQAFPLESTDVMNLAIEVVNKRIKPPTITFVIGRHSKYVIWSPAGWESLVAVQRGGAETAALDSKGLIFPALEQPDWLEKQHIVMDRTAHLKTLSRSLQERGIAVLQTLAEALTFECKMTMFARDIQGGMLSHFTSLTEFKVAHNLINCNYLQHANMQTAFWSRFCEFREEKNKTKPVYPSPSLPWALIQLCWIWLHLQV